MVREEANCYTPGDHCEEKYKHEDKNRHGKYRHDHKYRYENEGLGDREYAVISIEDERSSDNRLPSFNSGMSATHHELFNTDTEPFRHHMHAEMNSLIDKVNRRRKFSREGLVSAFDPPTRRTDSKNTAQNHYNVEAQEDVYDIRELDDPRRDRGSNAPVGNEKPWAHEDLSSSQYGGRAGSANRLTGKTVVLLAKRFICLFANQYN